MVVKVPDFGLEGLTGKALRDRVTEILKEGIAEGDTTTMDLFEDHLVRATMNEILHEDQLKHDPCYDGYEDEDTRKAIDLFGREEWKLAIKEGRNPLTILESAGCIGSSNKFKIQKKSMLSKMLLKLKLAKEVNNES